jgi:hypothetical protein
MRYIIFLIAFAIARPRVLRLPAQSANCYRLRQQNA